MREQPCAGTVLFTCTCLFQLSPATCFAVCPAESGGTCSSDTGVSQNAKITLNTIVSAGVAYPTGDKTFKVFQPFPQKISAELADPFLMCDEWGTQQKQMGVSAVDPGPPKTMGERHVGWHPHRGFDLLSYVKEGRSRHADSLGNLAMVRPGGIQWMRAGSGIEHAEGGGTPEGANQHGFQIWINLPAQLKMSKPQFGTVQPENVPEIRSEGGGISRVLAGPGGAGFRDRSDMHIADCEVPPNSSHTHVIPFSVEKVIVYVYHGQGTVAKATLQSQQAALFQVVDATSDLPGEGMKIEVQASEDGFGALVFAGRSLGESISWRGPIVMNTEKEVNTAYNELRRGTFYKDRVSYDYQAVAEQSGQ